MKTVKVNVGDTLEINGKCFFAHEFSFNSGLSQECTLSLRPIVLAENPIEEPRKPRLDQKHSHYKKPVTGLDFIDVYRVLELFEVTDPCLQHAIKKLLCAGQRGAKDMRQDVQEALDTLNRRIEMWSEIKVDVIPNPKSSRWYKNEYGTVPIEAQGEKIEIRIYGLKGIFGPDIAENFTWDKKYYNCVQKWRYAP